jgi:alkanesulfonate monooxygenase SsuD/methylene tetrahydromethanopterin reductase-like flavin-dependent oxidoreductase (luciferase family)
VGLARLPGWHRHRRTERKDQRPHVAHDRTAVRDQILIGGRSTATLRVVAEHADLWNIPGGDIDDAVRRGALLDRFCAEIGRDPASITRSIVLPVSYDHPSNTRDAIAETIDAGFQHIVLGLPAPYPENVARWATNELINKSASRGEQGSGGALVRRPRTASGSACGQGGHHNQD